MSRTCPSCQAALTPKSRFCPVCGTASNPVAETVEHPTGVATQVSRGSSGPESTAAAPVETKAEPVTTPSRSIPAPAPQSVPASLPPRPVAPPPAPAPAAPASVPAFVASSSPSRLTRSPFGEGECPFALYVNFNHALVDGNVSTIGFRVVNEGVTPIENAEIYVSSRGLQGESLLRVRRLAPTAKSDLLAEVEAARSGNFILQLAVAWDQGGQRYAFRGQRPLRIYKTPENSNVVINISDINSNTGGGANQALGAEYGDVQISNLIEKGAIKTLNDLLEIELPDNFQRIPLELDYEVSHINMAVRGATGGLRIPPGHLATVQPATVCTFEPVGVPEPPLPFRLVARPQFRLGRARADADFVSWVLPRNASNDEKSKRVSKVQAIAELTADGIVIRDNASANGTLFDNVPLDDKGTTLPRQGRLLLAGAVEVDFDRIAPASEAGPVIANLRQWAGPDAAPLPQRGAVRFEVVSSDAQPLNAFWLLSDASFGTSRSNAVSLADPTLAEVQGRIHHFRGCFWIETTANNSAVQVDHTTLRPGEIVPLASGQQLRLGSRTWRLRLES